MQRIFWPASLAAMAIMLGPLWTQDKSAWSQDVTITITKQEKIDLNWRANYWEAQHARAKSQIEALKQENSLKDAKIKDLQNRLFGKKSEKNSPLKSEKGNVKAQAHWAGGIARLPP